MNTDDIQQRIDEIETLMNQSGFWSDSIAAQKVASEYSLLQKKLSSMAAGIMPGSEYSDHPVIMTIMSGAGGDDSEDFTRMLYEMYQSFCVRRGCSCSLMRSNQNDHGGYRSLSFRVLGDAAFDVLRLESGVHRLIRISPFNSKGKRQTSFCMVEVVPEIVSDADTPIPKDDLEIQFARSGGPGGQNVNKRETAVRVTHVPSGISVHADGERTQEANREQAMTILRGKLAVLRIAQAASELSEHQISKTVENEWGSQIRTYTLHPYRLVKDHRSGIETSNIDAVLHDGMIEQFTESLHTSSH